MNQKNLCLDSHTPTKDLKDKNLIHLLLLKSHILMLIVCHYGTSFTLVIADQLEMFTIWFGSEMVLVNSLSTISITTLIKNSSSTSEKMDNTHHSKENSLMLLLHLEKELTWTMKKKFWKFLNSTKMLMN